MKKTIIAISSIVLLLFLVACGGRSVKITFDAKGGTAVESMTVTQLTEITEPTTTRTGYTFKGWYTEDTYINEFEFASGATRNITLYAKWEINQYTINFETDSAETINPITGDYQSNLTIPSSLIREGYTFGGWYTDSARTKAFESTRMPAENLTLFAKWNAIFHTLSFYVEDSLLTTRQVQWGEEVLTLPAVPAKEGYNGAWNIQIGQVVTSDISVDAIYTLKTYTVTFVDQWDTVYDTQTVNHGSSPVLPDTPVKEGFTFSAYSEDVENLIITEDTVINVLFSPITYLVTFRVQGSGVKTETVVHGASATAPSVSVDGYVFMGWDKDFTDITSNLEVNAILEAIPYNIHLNANGGLFTGGEETDVITADYQSTVNYSVQPQRTGYNFAGWYLNPEGTGSPVVLTNYTMPLDGLNLYAKWTLVTYNITYYNLLGAQNGNPQSYNITSSITLTPPTTRTGYTFAGWFDAETGGNQITNIQTGTYGNLNIYARWTANEYTITFNTDGGTAILPLTVTYNQPFTLEDAVKTGYTFVEWQLSGVTFTEGVWTRIANITVNAVYTANTYTITFDANGGLAVNPLAVTYDQTFTLPVTTKAGYNFTGWTLEGVPFVSETWNLTNDITLVADYSLNEYGITYNNLFTTTHTNPLTYTVETPTISLADPTARTGYTFVGWFTSLSGGTEVTEIALGSTGNVTVYARWIPTTYTITYNNLQGSTTTNPTTYNIESSTITLTAPTARTGYNFAGWFDQEIGGNQVTSIITGSTGNRTLYAHWTAKTYTITFNVDGGTAIDPLTVTYDQPFTLPEAVKTGYSFVEWQLNDVTFTEGVWTRTANITINAEYTANTYTITFNTNGGTSIIPMTVTYDEAFTLPSTSKVGFNFTGWLLNEMPFVSGIWNLTNDITLDASFSINEYGITYENLFGTNHTNPLTYNVETPTFVLTDPTSRTGYTFVGWFDSLSGGNEVSEVALGSTGNINLYARWSANSYTITFNSNGGLAVAPLVVTFGSSFVLPETEQSGYSFAGWTYNASPIVSGIWNIASDITVVAVWTEWPVIDFISNGGSSVSPISVAPGEAILEPTAPTKDGYTFAGWYSDMALTLPYTFTVMPESDLTLYAGWDVVQYSITFLNLNGSDQTNPAYYDIETPTITLVDPTSRTGYTFQGWFTALSGGLEVTEITLGTFGDITLYARWTPITYMITYDNLQGTSTTNPTSYNIETPTITLTSPTSRTGYNFIGWFDAEVAGNQVTQISVGSTGDMILYANWSPKTYTITFNTDGGTAISPMTVTYNESFTLPVAVKTGYTFIEWQFNELTFIDGVWTRTNNITINAIYTANTYTITFDTNGGAAIDPMTVTYDQPFTLPVASKDGFYFNEWLYGGAPFTMETWLMTSDINLTANYIKLGYLITYENLFGTTHTNLVNYDIEYPTIILTDPTSRTGYTFVGWFTDLTGGTEVTEITSGSFGDITLYARWIPITYTITYNNLQGTSTTNPTAYNIETPTITLTSPTSRTGYNFVGWFDAEVAGNQVTQITLGSTGDIVLYARWMPINYTITFDIDGVLTTIQLPYGYTIQASDIPAIPTKANYDLTSPYWTPEPLNHTVTGNKTFTAIYIGNPMTVSYETNGGNVMGDDTVPYNELLVQPTAPTRNGYTFLAWYIDSSLTILYDFNDPVLSNITLYAAWELDFYTWDIEYIFLQEDLNDPNIVITDPNQGSIFNSITGLYYGLEVSPVQLFEGYIFDYFLYDSVEYANIEQLIMVTGDRLDTNKIQVFYRKIILTITFAQDPTLFDPASGAVVSFRVYYNDDFLIANAPALVQPSGALAVWDRTLFDNVRTDITVYAIYYQTGVKTVTFVDRGVIKYIAYAIDELGNTVAEVLGADSILWDLYRPGYKFLGWFDAETGGTQIVQGDLLFSQFPDLRTSLYAQWLQLEAFVTPTNMTVTTSETEIVITWDLTTPTINGLQPVGYDFYLNNRLISGLATMPVLSGTTYTLTLISTNPDFDEFAELLSPGTHQLSLRVLGDEDNHYHSAFTDNFSYSIDSIFEGDPTAVAVYDYFIIETFGETKRYIFYTNLDYQFASTYAFEIVTGQEFATASANTISTNGISGSFKFRMIRDGYPTVTYDALVVHDVKQFAIGNNYQAFLNAKVANQTAFIDEAVDYYVGTANEFYLDLRMVNNQGQRIPLAQTLLDYTLYQYDTGNFIEVAAGNLDDYITFLPNNQLQLKALTIGGTFKLVVEPKYQANSMQVAPLEFVFTVNNGVNVYTNQQLKTYFSDYNVHIINIHASFVAELSSEQKNLDGSPINKVPTVSNPVTGNVYQRYSATIADDTLTIQGNFMSIDGSTLPFNNANSGSGTVGFAQSFEVISVQVGMFYYGMGPSDGSTNDSSFTMNNLIVKGNTSTPYVDFSGTPEDIEIQERLMSKNSGGYTGVMVRAGSAYLDNLVILNTVIAVFNTTYSYKTNLDPNLITIDYVKTYNNWANTIYLHGGLGFIISNSEVGSSGGAAIHLVDTHPATFDGSWTELTNPNPYLEIQDNNIFNNWVSGEEAWFKAYGMSQVALTLKSGIENGISATERSIINLYTDPVTGLETEKINFILLTEPYSSANVYSDPNEINQVSGSEVYLSLGAYDIERSFDYLDSGDPRVITTPSKQFAFPVGAYSDVAAFNALFTDLYVNYTGGDATAASNLAQIAGFYGLTSAEVAYTYSQLGSFGGSWQAAVAGIFPTKVLPQYIEVLAPVPVFTSGYSVVIIEFAE